MKPRVFGIIFLLIKPSFKEKGEEIEKGHFKW